MTDVLQKIELAVDNENEGALLDIENHAELNCSSDETWFYICAIAHSYRKGLACKSLAYSCLGNNNGEAQRLLDKAQNLFLKAEQIKQECL